jgi:PKD repeat protein
MENMSEGETMKTVIKFFLTLAIVVVFSAGMVLFGTSFETFNQKSPGEQLSTTENIPRFNGELLNFYAGDPVGNITITAKMPESPSNLNIYHGLYNEGDFVNIKPNSSKEGGNVTSESDAPDLAKNILNQYGGLPSDAIYRGANTVYLYRESRTTGDFVKTDALFTSLSWWRMLDGKRIIGDCDIIYIELGDNGEPLRIKKQWRTYSLVGNVPIIPVSKAISKLKNGEVISSISGNVDDINFFGITLGYYAKKNTSPEITLEPVWIFYGNTSSGSYLSLEIYARQFANFTATSTSGSVPLTVSFMDTSDASPVQWFWNFGDGMNSTEQSPTHNYTTAGTYNVSLRVWNDLGSDSIERTSFVQAGTITQPLANFTATPTSGKVPLIVQFNDTSDNKPTVWSWDFGDSTNSTEQNPIHTYTRAGNYSVILNAINADGGGILSLPDYIIVIPNPPVPNFTATPLFGKVPLTVQFNDSSSGGVPTLRYWDFGDGTNSTGQDPVHTYAASGNYTVILELANEDADVFETKQDYIHVLPPTPPVVAFSANATTGKAPLAVQFTDASTNTPTAWEWSFGDGYVSTEQNPVHRYTVSGTYDVSLNATNADGSRNFTKPAYIMVAEPVNAIDLIDQLIVYVDNQRNVPHIYQRFMIGELMDVKRSLNENRPGDAVMGMKFFKLTVSIFRSWPLTKDQTSTMQNSADAIIKAINLPVNQAAIDQTKTLSDDVKNLNLPNQVERPLTLELDSAVFYLECAKDNIAISDLNMFIGSVRAQDGKKILQDKASQLIAKAEAIKTLL